MEWSDEGIVLSARKHGENSVIAHVLTRAHGRHGGLVRGGTGKRARGIWMPGNRVQATWRGRLPEHLGAFTGELTEAIAAGHLNDPARLAALSAACAVTEAALPEREAHPDVFEGLLVLLHSLGGEAWPTVYVKWELGVLGELGYGLDLSACAATGVVEDLSHVSPKSGRAVSRAATGPNLDSLLPLPPFLLRADAVGGADEILDGLRLSGYFLERYVFSPHGADMPPARGRLIARLRRDDAGPDGL